MQQQSNSKGLSVTLIHLIWIPYGIELFRRFIVSYKNFNAGYDHELLLVFNGIKEDADNKEYHAYARDAGISYQSMNVEKGQDLDCYFLAAGQLSTDYIMILNSFSELLYENWLRKYIDYFEKGGEGMVGASGSEQSYYSSVFQKNVFGWEANKGFVHNFRKYKLFIKAFCYWHFLFKPFPNPHLRTNAFMLRRELMLQIKYKPLTSKFKAYQFESGRKSFTNQLLKMGYAVSVIDKDGNVYAPPEWKLSKTFWISNQENLLIADNQTMIYQQASEDEKKQMQKLAWGNK